jgi:hypothetical protein
MTQLNQLPAETGHYLRPAAAERRELIAERENSHPSFT